MLGKISVGITLQELQGREKKYGKLLFEANKNAGIKAKYTPPRKLSKAVHTQQKYCQKHCRPSLEKGGGGNYHLL